MTLKAKETLEDIQKQFKDLLEYVQNNESHSSYQVELHLFRQLLLLDKQLLLLFFLLRSKPLPKAPLSSKGVTMENLTKKSKDYYSVFGKFSFKRHYFNVDGEGCYPLDAQLQLPKRCYSNLLREWLDFAISGESYHEGSQLLSRILGFSISVQVMERLMVDDSVDVEAFYEQHKPKLAEKGSILVVQADGKGIPMVSERTGKQKVRLSKGEKLTRKKEAIVTSLYTIEPYERTPEEVVRALMQPKDAEKPNKKRPSPINKELRGTLQGKEIAIDRLAERATLQDNHNIEGRVALTDGCEALQRQMQKYFPKHILILDIIHATEYLWEGANALLGEANDERNDWVTKHLTTMLKGKSEKLISELQECAGKPKLKQGQIQVLKKLIGYYSRNSGYMSYGSYLASGYPIGTGVVEGACGHLVKSRLDGASMRWKTKGAEAVMGLRGIRLSEHWEEYWQFHRQSEAIRLYGNDLISANMPLEKSVLHIDLK